MLRDIMFIRGFLITIANRKAIAIHYALMKTNDVLHM